jgi:uncharacterized glyoxalase superfamily protein PhnB
MDESLEMEAPRLYPTLRYEDADAAINWLKQVVGFTERVVYRAGQIVMHAELAFGSAMLMLGQARDDRYATMLGGRSGRRTDAIYVAVDDLDTLYARVLADGAKIEAALHDTDYGSREFACRDPEGNLWSFGTYWPKAHERPAPG